MPSRGAHPMPKSVHTSSTRARTHSQQECLLGVRNPEAQLGVCLQMLWSKHRRACALPVSTSHVQEHAPILSKCASPMSMQPRSALRSVCQGAHAWACTCVQSRSTHRKADASRRNTRTPKAQCECTHRVVCIPGVALPQGAGRTCPGRSTHFVHSVSLAESIVTAPLNFVCSHDSISDCSKIGESDYLPRS